ncbi:MAG: hypothetical protein WC449_05525 [Candidatus Paceibacterota bacterium]
MGLGAKWESGSLIFTNTVAKSGILQIGKKSNTVGDGINIGTLTWAELCDRAFRVSADDGGVGFGAGDYGATLCRLLLTTNITGLDVSLNAVKGLLKAKGTTTITSTGVISGVFGGIELADTASIGACAFSGVHGSVDIPAGCTLPTSYYAAAFSAGANLAGTTDGKAVVMHVLAPLSGTWDAMFEFDSSTGVIADSGAGGGTSKYIKCLINGVAYSVLIKSDA